MVASTARKRNVVEFGNKETVPRPSRYADDWLILTNGSKAEAHRLRDEIQTFLQEELHLELSVEKTHVTHVNDGFDFLGFHVRRYTSQNDRPKLLVTPSQKAVTPLKAKIKEMTARKRFRDQPLLKFSALNAVLRGWLDSFRHSNAKETAKDLDFWVNERLFLWLQKRHRLPPNQILDLYKQREQGTRDNWGIRNGETILYLYRMSDQPITKYRSRNPPNPYLAGEWVTTLNLAEAPQPENVWLGNAENNEEWRELKEEIKAERGAKCDLCGSRENLDSTTSKPNATGEKRSKRICNGSAEAVTRKLRPLELAVDCNEGKRSDGKLSRFVWGEGWMKHASRKT